MFDGTNYNSPCSFAEEIIEYIYDEMNGEMKASFETHLAKCNSCADELAGFGIVRSQVSNWKLSEFSPLATPVTQLPVEQTEGTQIKRRWFDNLRDLVMLSPAWKTQTAAFATLVICFGLAYFVINNPRNNVGIIDPTPIGEIAKATPNAIPTPPINTSPTPKVEVDEPNPAKPIVAAVKTITPKKVLVQAVQTAPKQTVIVPKTKPNRGTKPAPVQPKADVNLVSDDEDEDDSLRLSDLFDEVSMK
jgi:hypothetical protein